jgi:hypothetical protein
LADDEKSLRFQVLDANHDEVISELCSCGWLPNRVSPMPRFTSTGLVPANMFEIEIRAERQRIVDDRPRVSGEIAKPEKTPAEVEHMRRYLGWSK